MRFLSLQIMTWRRCHKLRDPVQWCASAICWLYIPSALRPWGRDCCTVWSKLCAWSQQLSWQLDYHVPALSSSTGELANALAKDHWVIKERAISEPQTCYLICNWVITVLRKFKSLRTLVGGVGHSYQAGKSPMPYLLAGSDESLRFPDRTTKL